MTGMNSLNTAWPYPKAESRAWTPGDLSPSVMSIPLLPNDKVMTLDLYLSRLSDRVQWMLNQAGDPMQAFRETVEPKAEGKADLRGINPDRFASLGNQMVMAWEDLLRQYQELNRVKFPVTATSQPEAVEAIRETDLAGWLDELLPANHE